MGSGNLEDKPKAGKHGVKWLCCAFLAVLLVAAAIVCLHKYEVQSLNRQTARSRQLVYAAAEYSLLLSSFAQSMVGRIAKNRHIAALKPTGLLAGRLKGFKQSAKGYEQVLEVIACMAAEDYFKLKHSAEYCGELFLAALRRVYVLDVSKAGDTSEAAHFFNCLAPAKALNEQGKAEWQTINKIRRFVLFGLKRLIQPLEATALKLASALDNMLCLSRLNYESGEKAKEALAALNSELSSGFASAALIKDLYGRELIKIGSFYDDLKPDSKELYKMRRGITAFYGGKAKYIKKRDKAFWYVSAPIRGKNLQPAACLGMLIDLSKLKDFFNVLSASENLIFANAQNEALLFKQHCTNNCLPKPKEKGNFFCRIKKINNKPMLQSCLGVEALKADYSPNWHIIYTKEMPLFEDEPKILFIIVVIMLVVMGLVVLYCSAAKMSQIYFSHGEA